MRIKKKIKPVERREIRGKKEREENECLNEKRTFHKHFSGRKKKKRRRK